MVPDTSSNRWLDTETKACLQRSPPLKLSPPTTERFSIVVLYWEPFSDQRRRVRAFERVLRTTLTDAEFEASRRLPFVVKRGLTLSDAMLAQFELICCDIASVLIADPVISAAEPQYLADLYNSLIRSDEFATLRISVTAIPPNELGRQFVQQFIGNGNPSLPHTMRIMLKKARIMTHWAGKIGAAVSAVR